MPLSYLHYDVFTRDPFLGNQLAVFTDARGLDARRMQQLAREMNFSESTFVLPAEQAGTDIRMRIFTPTSELPMAGHPTIGSTFALAETGVLRSGTPRFVFGLGSGPTPVDLEWNGGSLTFAWMTQPTPEFGVTVDDREAVTSALGLTPADLRPDLPVQQVSCGLPYLFVPLRDRGAVDRAISDAAALRRLKASFAAGDSMFLFSIDPPGSEDTVYSRMFAHEFGIVEDPATGSASGPLGCYLIRHGIVDSGRALRMSSLQGVAMGRRSRIHISIESTGRTIECVRVGGEAVLVGRGQLLL